MANITIIAAAAGFALAVSCMPPAQAATPAKTLRTLAATTGASAHPRRPRRVTRIVVYPASRIVRRCADWYAVEPRPSGTVVVPHMRCWWAYR